ncbi:MAG: helix-turn-helix domain-containing protein [Vulcanimicrobiaceae bacterium]
MSPSSGPPAIERVLQYIGANFRRRITPRQVAAAVNYSPCYLTNLTRKELGSSLGDLILTQRIRAASALLEETTLPVSLIATRVGFADTAYFSRRFSQKMGTAPSRWRELHRAQAHARGALQFCPNCGRTFPAA